MIGLVLFFSSNTAGNGITQFALEHWNNGEKRETMKLRDVEEIITLEAFNEKG